VSPRHESASGYDPDHDALWAAIWWLKLTVIALGVAVLCLIAAAVL
jgi:hypothetical protein